MGTGTFLNYRKEEVYILSLSCIDVIFLFFNNKTLYKYLSGKQIIFITIQLCASSYCIPQGSHQSYLHSHPPHHTSRTAAYTECYYTGTHHRGSAVPLKGSKKNTSEIHEMDIKGEKKDIWHTNKTISERCRHSYSLEISQISSSLPSMQSASASQCQRSGIQWPFLHWNWSSSHFRSQPYWETQ